MITNRRAGESRLAGSIMGVSIAGAAMDHCLESVNQSLGLVADNGRTHLTSNTTPQIRGYIGYYGLSEWWLNTFREDERIYINDRVRTMRAGPNALIEGTPFIPSHSTRDSASFFLIVLTSWFRKPKDNSIARRIALKALELAEDLEDIGASLAWIIRLYYPIRDQLPGASERVVSACKRYIELAPSLVERHKKLYPKLSLGKHEGYDRYVILLERDKDYSEVIRLC